MTGTLSPVTPMEKLGAKVRAARIAQRYDVQSASRAAGIARDTWKRVENGQGVHDVKRAAVLDLLGLDQLGDPVGDLEQDPGYVGVPEQHLVEEQLDPLTTRELRDELRAIRAVLERLADRETPSP